MAVAATAVAAEAAGSLQLELGPDETRGAESPRKEVSPPFGLWGFGCPCGETLPRAKIVLECPVVVTLHGRCSGQFESGNRTYCRIVRCIDLPSLTEHPISKASHDMQFTLYVTRQVGRE